MYPADLTTFHRREDEISLGDLVGTLIRRRRLVLFGFLSCLALAIAYLLIATPRYEIDIHVDRPFDSEIVALNLGRTAATGLPAYNTEQVFGYFLRELRSDRAFQNFFRNIYLPSLDDARRDRPEARLYKEARKLLEIRPPDAKAKGRGLYTVRVAADDPEKANVWLERFLETVAHDATSTLMQDARSGIEVAIRNAERDVAELRLIAAKKRADRARQLGEALVVATAINLREPQMTLARPPASDSVSAFVDGSTLYARGMKSLSAELEVLKNRESDGPFIAGLRDTESRLRMWQSALEYDPKSFRIFRIDGEVIVPVDPVKPKKELVLALAAMLGLVSGVMMALIAEALSTKRPVGIVHRAGGVAESFTTS